MKENKVRGAGRTLESSHNVEGHVVLKDSLVSPMDGDSPVVRVVDGAALDVLAIAQAALKMPMNGIFSQEEGLRGEEV